MLSACGRYLHALVICGSCSVGSTETGIRWEYHSDEQGVGPLLLCGEDTTSGFCHETLYQGEVVMDDPDNIGTIETFGLARMMWFLAHIVPPRPKIFVITDRMASLRNLELHDGKDIRRKYTRSFRLAMKLFRVYLTQAITRHGRIRFEHYGVRSYDANWRADQLSRVFAGSRVHPMEYVDHDELMYGIRLNCDADNDRYRWNPEMFAAQTLAFIHSTG